MSAQRGATWPLGRLRTSGYLGSRRRTGILLVLPALVVMLAVLAYPIVSSIVL